MSWDIEAFKEKLETEHKFPGKYYFKFIVPINKENEVMEILPQGELSKRLSKNNNYVSISLKAMLESSADVIGVYEKAYAIDGIIAL